MFGFWLAATLILAAQTPPPAPSQVPHPPPVPDDLVVTHDVEIGKGGDKILHAELVQPKDPTKRLPRAVIYVHGGGWAGGSTVSEIGRAYQLAKAGYFVASVQYRLSVEAKWPAQIEDCKLAVRWLRANAAQYQIDPDHIGVAGQSAGGHLVACLGTMDDPKFEGTGGYPGVSSKVQAVEDTSGPVDFTNGNFYDGDDFVPPAQKPKSDSMLITLFGATFAANPDVWKEGSPITHVKAGDPPFLIACGEHDQIVSPEQGKTFAAALEKVGVPVELIIVKNGIHSLAPAVGGPPSDPDPNTLRLRLIAFFDKYLK